MSDSVAYDTRATPYRGYAVRATYHDGSQNATIDVFKGEDIWRSFEYPAYRIYNILAHFNETVDNEVDSREILAADDGESTGGAEPK